MKITFGNHNLSLNYLQKIKNNMLFKNILVPWDGSQYSNNAFKTALNLAEKYNSKIIGISCIDIIFRGHWYYESEHYQQKLQQQRKSILNKISNFEKIATKKNIPFTFKIFETRSTVEKITSFAKLKKIDLIVMGSHGRTGIDKFLLGSVANGVVQRARCPIMIIK